MFFIGLLFLFISTFVALFNYYYYHNNIILGSEERVLWGQLTLYNSSLLFPPLLSIFIGMSFLPEFERKTLNMLRANRVSMYKLVAGKIIALIGIVLPLQILYLVVYSSIN
ncbi:ABC transporter permease [Aerococcaceae bacterium zg-B36]|uniref:ABC transporter permease n=1 Tax=Aerococcaceae bacterium zg-252 TaxID=2796928 RepID=UPI001BD85608|nr:ABC transporter permease [Aerococcaceae bacterium zg-B36]